MTAASARSIPIFINRRKYEVEPGVLTGREILALAGLTEGYDLLLLNGEGDPTGGELVLADQPVELRPGMHFRAIPGNRTFGLGVPPILAANVDELAGLIGRAVSVADEGSQVFVVVERAALPAGVYSVSESDVLMITDGQYPLSAMDMFWMEERATLADGSVPSHASSIETYLGRRWRRWSWHRNGVWTPGVDDIRSHWAFIEACWAKEAA